MTIDEIRNVQTDSTDSESLRNIFLREITAQLAELNETLRGFKAIAEAANDADLT